MLLLNLTKLAAINNVKDSWVVSISSTKQYPGADGGIDDGLIERPHLRAWGAGCATTLSRAASGTLKPCGPQDRRSLSKPPQRQVRQWSNGRHLERHFPPAPTLTLTHCKPGGTLTTGGVMHRRMRAQSCEPLDTAMSSTLSSAQALG